MRGLIILAGVLLLVFVLMMINSNAMEIEMVNKTDKVYIGYAYRFDHPDFPHQIVPVGTAEIGAGKSFIMTHNHPAGDYGFKFAESMGNKQWSMRNIFGELKKLVITVYNDRLVITTS